MLLKLSEVLSRKPQQLSGGKGKMLLGEERLSENHQFSLFDEPLSNLDAKLTVQTQLEFHELQSKVEIKSDYVTHDQVKATSMAGR